MQYVLGNMLNGGGINPDGLSLDLQFAADKTFSKPSSLAAGETAITSRRGPSATFLRSTAATEVGPDGLIRYAPENLLTKSEEFNDAAWSRAAVGVAAATITPNSDIAPDGTTTADTANFSATTATNQQGMLFRNALTATIGQVVTFSVYMRVPSGTATVFIGLSEGIPLSVQSVACNVTTTWQRFSITRTAVAATQIYPEIGPDTRSLAGQPAVQPAASVFLWGAQLERHTSARAYIPTTTAAVYGPRFDHDPVTLACKGLLIEEAKTNLAWHANSTTGSGNLTPPDGSTLTNNFGVAPDGTTTTALIADNSTLYSYGISLNNSTRTAFAANSTVCGSLYIRKKTSAGYEAQIALSFAGGAGGSYSRYRFNYVTGVALSNGDLAVTSTSVSVLDAGDFWRIIITAAPTNGSTVASISITPAAFNTMGVFDITLTGNSEFWGNQVELGAFPTSLIITSGAPLTRSADVCSITGAGFNRFYNQPEGTLFVDVTPQTVDQNAFVFGVNTTTFNSSHGIYKTNATVTAEGKRWICLTFNTSTQTEIATPTDIAVSRSRLAYAYKINDYAFAYAGGIVGTDTSATVPSPTAMRIGSRDDGRFVNGHLASIRYYKKRLPNAKLVQLTV